METLELFSKTIIDIIVAGVLIYSYYMATKEVVEVLKKNKKKNFFDWMLGIIFIGTFSFFLIILFYLLIEK